LAQALQGTLATLLLLSVRQGWRWRRGGLSWRGHPQAHPTDLEVFLEAVGLEEVGEFEGADVAALSADLPLEIGDHGAQILARVAQAQQLIPHPFPVKGQAQGLAGQLAIELVGGCRVVLDTNRYTVPYLYASQQLTLKIYPDQRLLYHHEKLIATHLRSYDRRQDVRNPDHIQELLVHRHRAREQTFLQAFLSLGPQTDLYARKLQEKRLNAPHHIQKIVALSQLYGPDQVARALADALTFEAYGGEYIANILEQRERQPIVPSPLHLTRRQDLLELDLPQADLSLYGTKPPSSTPL
jgi:hypothetical protein